MPWHLASGQHGRYEVCLNGCITEPAQGRRLQLVAPHVQHRSRLAIMRKDALHRPWRRVLEPRPANRIGRAARSLPVQREFHVYPALSVRRGLALHKVVLEESGRHARGVNFAFQDDAGDVPDVRKILPSHRDEVAASGGALVGVNPLNLGDLVSNCVSEMAIQRKKSERQKRRTRFWAPSTRSASEEEW